jgi:S1-C subfamily serine protease
LQAGDVALEVNGRTITDSVALRNRLNEVDVGEKVELKISRVGVIKTIMAEMAEAPAELSEPAFRSRLGQ